ncbi:MAG TPA: hypothetical protein VF777_03190 [Phycisphaerales bacterium]
MGAIKLGALLFCVNACCLSSIAAEPIGDPLPRRPSSLTQYSAMFAAVDWTEFDRFRTRLDPRLIALPTGTHESLDIREFVACLYEQQLVISDLDHTLRQAPSQLSSQCDTCGGSNWRDISVLHWMLSFSTLITFDGQRCAAEEDWEGFATRVAINVRLGAMLLTQDDHSLAFIGWGVLERVDDLLSSVLRQGYAHRLSPKAAAAIRGAFAHVDLENPGRFRGRWRAMTEPRLRTFQLALSGATPVNAYTELVRKELSLNAIFPDIPYDNASIDKVRQFRDQTVARVAALSRDDVLRGLALATELTVRVADAIEHDDADALQAAVTDAERDTSGVVRLLWTIAPLKHQEFCERVRSTASRAAETMDQIFNSVNDGVPHR